MFVGGAREAMYSNPSDVEVLDLKRKMGFIRLALMYGVPVVPVYTFNEVDTFKQVSQKTIQRYPILSFLLHVFNRVSGIIFVLSFLLPSSTHYTTVVGSPIHFNYPTDANCTREPTASEINAAKNLYVKALKKLYERYSPIYSSNKNRKLVIT